MDGILEVNTILTKRVCNQSVITVKIKIKSYRNVYRIFSEGGRLHV